MHRISAALVSAAVLSVLYLQCLRPAAAQARPDASSSPAAPPAAAPSQDAGIPAAKEAKIRELIRLNGAARLGRAAIDQLLPAMKTMLPKVPESFWESFAAEIKVSELEDLLVPIYARHFTEAELQGLIDFYSSPLGRKVTGEMPAVMQESMAAGQAWGRDLAEKAVARAKEKGYKIET